MSILNIEWNLDDALRVRGQEERIKEREEIAEKLIKRGTALELIAEDTRLSIERVEEIAKRIDKKN